MEARALWFWLRQLPLLGSSLIPRPDRPRNTKWSGCENISRIGTTGDNGIVHLGAVARPPLSRRARVFAKKAA